MSHRRMVPMSVPCRLPFLALLLLLPLFLSVLVTPPTLSIGVLAAAGSAGVADNWFFSSTDNGCTRVSTIDQINGNASTATVNTCPPYAYAGPNNASAATPIPTAISIQFATVDAASNTLYEVESLSNGASAIVASPILNRVSSVHSTLPSDVDVVAMTLGAVTYASTPTPLLLLTRPELTLRQFDPATGALATLISSVDMKDTYGLGQIVTGALSVNHLLGEAYWMGVAYFETDFSMLRLYTYSYALGTVSSASIDGIEHPVALHYAPSLGGLIVVCASSVRFISVPASGLAGLTSNVVAQTVPFNVAGFDPAVDSLTYTSRITDFSMISLSSAWVSLSSTILLGVKLTYGYAVVEFTLKQSTSNAGGIESTGITIQTLATLPILLHGGIVPMQLQSIKPTSLVDQTAVQVSLAGIGFTQALVADSVLCHSQALYADGSNIMTEVVVPGVVVLNSTVASVDSPAYVQCNLSSNAIPNTTVTIRMTLTGVDGRVVSLSPLTLPVFCGPGREWIPTNYTSGVMPTGGCNACQVGFYKSTIGQSACTQCADGTSTLDTSSTSYSDCRPPNPCNMALPGADLNGGEGWSTSVQVRLRVDIAYVNFTLAKRADFMSLLSVSLEVSLTRLVLVDVQPGAPPEATSIDQLGSISIATIQVLPATEEEYLKCVANWLDGNYTSPNLQSPASILKDLQGQLADPNSPLHTNDENGLLISGTDGGSFLDAIVVLPSGKKPFDQCIKETESLLPIIVFVALLAAIIAAWIYVPCRRPRSQPKKPDARPIEIPATLLPLLAFVCACYFLVEVVLIADSNSMIILAIGAAILVLGFVHNVVTMRLMIRGQLSPRGAKSDVVSITDSKPKGPAVAYIAHDADADADAETPASSRGEKAGESSPRKATPPLVDWVKAHPTAAKVYPTIGCFNVVSLAMATSHLSMTGPYDLTWDPKLALDNDGQLFHRALRRAAIRCILFRHAPMIALQVWASLTLECGSALFLAPLIGEALATIILAIRFVSLAHLPEPNPPFVLRKGAESHESDEEDDDGDESDESGRDSDEGEGAFASIGGDGMLAGANAAPIDIIPGVVTGSDEGDAAPRPHDWILKERIAKAEEARKEIAANPHGWILFDDDITNVPESDIKRVELLDENGMPYEPARMQCYLRRPEQAELEQRASAAIETRKEMDANPHGWILFEEADLVGIPEADIKRVELLDAAGLPFTPARMQCYLRATPEQQAAAVEAEEQRLRQHGWMLVTSAASQAAAPTGFGPAPKNRGKKRLLPTIAPRLAGVAAEASAARTAKAIEARKEIDANPHEWILCDEDDEAVRNASDDNIRRIESLRPDQTPFNPPRMEVYVRRPLATDEIPPADAIPPASDSVIDLEPGVPESDAVIIPIEEAKEGETALPAAPLPVTAEPADALSSASPRLMGVPHTPSISSHGGGQSSDLGPGFGSPAFLQRATTLSDIGWSVDAAPTTNLELGPPAVSRVQEEEAEETETAHEEDNIEVLTHATPLNQSNEAVSAPKTPVAPSDAAAVDGSNRGHSRSDSLPDWSRRVSRSPSTVTRSSPREEHTPDQPASSSSPSPSPSPSQSPTLAASLPPPPTLLPPSIARVMSLNARSTIGGGAAVGPRRGHSRAATSAAPTVPATIESPVIMPRHRSVNSAFSPASSSSSSSSPSLTPLSPTLSPSVGVVYPSRRVAKVLAFGSGSGRDRLTADEIREQKKKAIVERAREAAAGRNESIMAEEAPNHTPIDTAMARARPLESIPPRASAYRTRTSTDL